MIAAIYDKATGAIDYVVECSEKIMDEQCGETQGYVEVPAGFDDATHYVDLGTHTVMEKQPQPVSLSVEGLVATIEGLAEGTEVEVSGRSLLVDDTSTEITFDVPGSYVVAFMGSVPHLDGTVEVVIDG